MTKGVLYKRSADTPAFLIARFNCLPVQERHKFDVYRPADQFFGEGPALPAVDNEGHLFGPSAL